MRALHEATRWPTNLSKLGQVVQDKDETPGAFLECLMEAYKQEKNQSAINMAFVNQAVPDIQRKLQTLN